MTEAEPQFLDVGEGANRRRIAYRHEPPRPTGVGGRIGLLWLSGLKSDMTSTKATALASWAQKTGFGFTRFDYSGHGLSEGRFEDGTIGAWLEEAYAVCTRVALMPEFDTSDGVIPHTLALPTGGRGRVESPSAEGPLEGSESLRLSRDAVPPPLWGRLGGGESQTSDMGFPPSPSPSPQGGGELRATPLILVGSSMGAHIALLLLRGLLETTPGSALQILGLVLIAPAWDMTEELIWKSMAEEDRRRLVTEGVFPLPSPYGEPAPITRALILEGRAHLLAGRPFTPGCPVHILQGLRDEDVPPEHARRLLGLLEGGHVEITEIPDGDHRLSRPHDLDLLFGVIERMALGRELLGREASCPVSRP